uniref:Uncharacterized protein n=1 Tax=Brassica oleracea var. oleracea TaxID=109376 RepID=A0A0D3EEC6_BRAOL
MTRAKSRGRSRASPSHHHHHQREPSHRIPTEPWFITGGAAHGITDSLPAVTSVALLLHIRSVRLVQRVIHGKLGRVLLGEACPILKIFWSISDCGKGEGLFRKSRTSASCLLMLELNFHSGSSIYSNESDE